MQKNDFMVKNNSAWNRKSTNPSTMASGQAHGPHAHPDVVEHVEHTRHPHNQESYAHRVGAHGHLLQREDGSSWKPNPAAITRNTQSPSLQPSDARHDKSFLQRCRDKFNRLLELCGG